MASKKKDPAVETSANGTGPAPDAMTPQGMPMQGMPMQGMPMQGMPMQGMPMQGMPMQGMPMQGMPMQGMPMQGMPMQAMMPMQPMMQMMQMMQGMMGMGGPMMVDPAALPFSSAPLQPDVDPGLDAEIIRPATLDELIKVQSAVKTGTVLDYLCLSDDGLHALGGVPKGCTIAFAGPPGRGKTRTALASLARIAASGTKVGFVVAEEGFHSPLESGRDDLCSRLVKVGMAATELDEKRFKEQVLSNMYVLEAPYHKHQSWDEFVAKYRYLVEREAIRFMVIDSLNTLDPTKSKTADNLSALKTYNHEKGLTCICIGQIRDTGQPVGGEALQHTADVVFLLEEMSLGSKEIAAKWGGSYRDKIDVVWSVKSVTTRTFPHPIRVDRHPTTGSLVVHAAQPEECAVFPVAD